MSQEVKKFNYTTGIFDVVCRDIRMKIKEEAAKEGAYGIGVYTDQYCEEVLMNCAMKSLEERMKIAGCFEGVDFVFPVDTRDFKHIEEIAENAYLKYIDGQAKEEENKKYKVGFVLGSFDVFHAGHLENLMLAKEICDKLIVVLKTDERILRTKNKMPKQSTAERAAILSLMKPINNILYMDLDTTREDVIHDVMELYKGIEKRDIVAIFGSDLRKKEEKYMQTTWAEINVVFTDRDPKKMEVVSSSNYQKKCDERGGLAELEAAESASLR